LVSAEQIARLDGQLPACAAATSKSALARLSSAGVALACRIVAPRQGYDEPGFLSLAQSGHSIRQALTGYTFGSIHADASPTKMEQAMQHLKQT
jgi:hypothetical protein